ncbi:molecular chaperone [Pantoea sp. 1.19]|uniref:fimbrial biogenesis chaperone n=1 Tax=Pantoea sp. 1.19 TaxID=1925589 RepID=UPI000948C257|nr:molecular chaperone [Pantoea sp. 1.19]
MSLRTFIKKMLLIALLSTISLSAARAGIMVNKTRIIFNQNDNSATATLSNVSKDNYAVQVWINGESERSDEEIPFIVTPTLFRVAPSEEQIVKIIPLPRPALPTDRESVYYFNAQEIPTVSKTGASNQLTVAIRTRLKLFYRPTGLAGSPDQAAATLKWARVDQGGQAHLRVTNPSPWNLSFSEIRFSSGGHTFNVSDPVMLKPFSHHDYALSGKTASRQGTVHFSIINDYGGISPKPDVTLD